MFDHDDLSHSWYNWNGGSNTTTAGATTSATVPTAFGAHTLNLYANDSLGFEVDLSYVFIVDDGANPVITLNSPTNNTEQIVGTVVDLDVADTTLATVTISVNDQTATDFPSPYDYTLSTIGSIKLKIVATDVAGNSATLLLQYTVIADVADTPTTTTTTTTPTTTTTTTPTTTTPTTSSTPDDTDDGDDGFLPGFTAIYALIAIMSLIQIVKFKRSRR
jgi:hypothetical protein